MKEIENDDDRNRQSDEPQQYTARVFPCDRGCRLCPARGRGCWFGFDRYHATSGRFAGSYRQCAAFHSSRSGRHRLFRDSLSPICCRIRACARWNVFRRRSGVDASRRVTDTSHIPFDRCSRGPHDGRSSVRRIGSVTHVRIRAGCERCQGQRQRSAATARARKVRFITSL